MANSIFRLGKWLPQLNRNFNSPSQYSENCSQKNTLPHSSIWDEKLVEFQPADPNKKSQKSAISAGPYIIDIKEFADTDVQSDKPEKSFIIDGEEFVDIPLDDAPDEKPKRSLKNILATWLFRSATEKASKAEKNRSFIRILLNCFPKFANTFQPRRRSNSN